MIISLRLKNFYSLHDETVLDFAADMSSRRSRGNLPENLLDSMGDKFVNIIGLFGSNAAGKSNIIKAIDYCRNLVLNSHLKNEGDELGNVPFKFDTDKSSEFEIDFVYEGIEYVYSFEIYDGKIKSEELYYYPRGRRNKVFSRTDTDSYTFKKGVIARPMEIVANTGPRNLFLSRASSMNREIACRVYRFFLSSMIVGLGAFDLSKLSRPDFDKWKDVLLKGFEVSDSDIVDIRLIESSAGRYSLQSFHREAPAVPFDFMSEESEGTKRLLAILMVILSKVDEDATFFIDEFDLKLHLRLAEFILDLIRASARSQFVFTSHNPWLINKETMRPEQIVIVTKQPDGNSEFVSLADFEGFSPDSDPRQAYLQGRFDGVPYVGNARDILTQLLDRKQ